MTQPIDYTPGRPPFDAIGGVGNVSPKVPFGGPKDRLRLVYIGDSIVQGDSDSRTNFWASRELPFNLMVASGGRLVAARNAGVGGQTSPFVASRFTRDVIKLDPDVVVVTVGINDVGTLASSSYITDVLTEINAVCQSRGILWFATTLTPANSYTTATIVANNTAIINFCNSNGVPYIDYYNQYNDPGNPGHWLTNYCLTDGIHPTVRTSYRMASYAWGIMSPYINSRFGAYTPKAIGVSNILFPAISNTGLPTSGTSADPLFNNSRSFVQNGYTVTSPYLFTTQFGTLTAGNVSGTVATMAGVTGKAWTITCTPDGAARTFTTQNSTSGGALNVSRFQGRRIRVSFKFKTSGFDTDNTDALFGAQATAAPVSGVGLSLTCLNSANTVIANTFISDPIDATPDLGISSSIPLETQLTVMGQPSGVNCGWCVDVPLTPVSLEMNIPVGANCLQFTINFRFLVAAVTPVSFTIAELCFEDAGNSRIDQIPRQSGCEYGYLNATTSVTITPAQAWAIPNYRIDATSGALAPVLPSAGSVLGTRLTFKKTDVSANAVTITRAGSDTIDGATTYVLATQYKYVTLQAVLGGWDVIAAG